MNLSTRFSSPDLLSAKPKSGSAKKTKSPVSSTVRRLGAGLATAALSTTVACSDDKGAISSPDATTDVVDAGGRDIGYNDTGDSGEVGFEDVITNPDGFADATDAAEVSDDVTDAGFDSRDTTVDTQDVNDSEVIVTPELGPIRIFVRSNVIGQQVFETLDSTVDLTSFEFLAVFTGIFAVSNVTWPCPMP